MFNNRQPVDNTLFLILAFYVLCCRISSFIVKLEILNSILYANMATNPDMQGISLTTSPVSNVLNETSIKDLFKRMDENEKNLKQQEIALTAGKNESTSLKLKLEENANKFEDVLKKNKELRDRCEELEKLKAVQDKLIASGIPRKSWMIVLSMAVLGGICVGAKGFDVAYFFGAGGIAQVKVTGASVVGGFVSMGVLGNVLLKW